MIWKWPRSEASSHRSIDSWIQVTARCFRRFARGKQSMTKSRESSRRSSKKPKKNLKARGGVKPNHAQPARHSAADSLCQEYATADEGDESRVRGQAAPRTGAVFRRPSVCRTA